ncbi:MULTISPECIES: serine/threonine-protein kinase [unclassified Aureimonas]|uniref:serine/threonine-protein kinase n=1 Tax=unclassified Aureimonas TaxID=2615206 RepID=UPI0006F30FBC|nr:MULTISPECIES: serine/threonine-protein kinase [unclassified Aureimonas]KQT58130.1 hypothetical protein ASG62_24760 [Aureimonas sp. Leaf427]KQT65680.1 hypothetical protein ASG54_22635 [Aureimonas sp. Leaf460]
MSTADYVSTLTRIKPLGDGAFGEVHLFHDAVHGDVAGKSFFRAKFGSQHAWDTACANALKEAQSLKALEHDHVVKIYQAVRTTNDDEFLLVMEYCEAGSIRQLTETNAVCLPTAKRIIRDAAIGLNYIHSSKYLHRDIKPDNILLKADGRVKLGDFGFVTDELQFGFATPYGTAIYLAPEVLAEKACSELSDVYSLGVTFVNLLSGDLWFLREGNGALLQMGADGHPLLSTDVRLLPHVPAAWRNVAKTLCKPTVEGRSPSLGAAVNSIAKLPAVEPWKCVVEDDVIRWELVKGQRRVRVEWTGYLGQKGESWSAWTENLDGSSRRKLKSSEKGQKWKVIYSSLRAFFASRTI